MYRKIISLIVVFLTINACATDPSSLKKTSSNQYFVLSEDLSRTAKVGVGYTMTEGLRKGKYIATYEDDSGIYFVGEDGAVFYRHELKTMNRDNKGGIWIPKDLKKDDPKIFYFIGQEIMENTTKSGTGLLGYGISGSQVEKIEFHPSFKDDVFMEKIKIMK